MLFIFLVSSFWYPPSLSLSLSNFSISSLRLPISSSLSSLPPYFSTPSPHLPHKLSIFRMPPSHSSLSRDLVCPLPKFPHIRILPLSRGLVSSPFSLSLFLRFIPFEFPVRPLFSSFSLQSLVPYILLIFIRNPATCILSLLNSLLPFYSVFHCVFFS